MQIKSKKGGMHAKLKFIIMLAIIAALAGYILLNKPSITGLVVVTKESSFRDSLGLVINESKNVTWNVKNPGNLNSIKLDGRMSRNGSAKVYIQKDNEKILLFDSTKPLFDVNVEVLPDYKNIFQGDELLVQIILFNLKGFGNTDVNVKYSIKDTAGSFVASEEEVVNVETQTKFVRKLLIPSDLKPGNYVAFVEVKTPDNLIGTSSDLFTVKSKYGETPSPNIKYYIFGLAAALILLVFGIIFAAISKKMKEKKRFAQLKERIPLEKKERLEKELKSLGEAYNSGFISEESYNKDKERLEKMLQGGEAKKAATETKEAAESKAEAAKETKEDASHEIKENPSNKTEEDSADEHK